MKVIVGVIKLSAVGAVTWWAWRHGDWRYRITALWIVWLVLSPVLWLHYLVVLIPLAGIAPKPRVPLAMVCVAALSLSLLIGSSGVDRAVVGHFVAFVWLTAAIALTWPVKPEDESRAAA